MAEGSATAFLRKIVTKTEPYIPQVPKPKKKLSLQKRLLWCGGILLIYMIMGQTPLFGATTPEFDFLAFARVIFASQQGTLVELGIGPIVTAGLLNCCIWSRYGRTISSVCTNWTAYGRVDNYHVSG